MSGLESHLIAGEWDSNGDHEDVSVNPAMPSEEVLRYAVARRQEVDDAVQAARDAARGWAATPAPTRGQVLRRAGALVEAVRDDLALLISRDQGKTVPEARGEVARAIETLYFHAAQVWQPVGEQFASSKAAEIVRSVRLPIGTIGVITPFNFPLAISAWKIAPALAHGNAVVWKPAEAAPAAAVELARILMRAGLPAGVLNLVQGGGSVGTALVEHEGIDAITFTGSVPVGHRIAEATTRRGVRFQGELGGHNAAVVFPDADLQRAATESAAGAMLGAGQKCTSTRRLIVHADVADQFTELLVTAVRAFRVGDGRKSGIDIGPVITAAARDNIHDAIESAVSEGAEEISGPVIDPEAVAAGGYFVRPTVLRGVRPDMSVAQEEVFGPVTSIITVADDDEAIAVANSTRFGLSTSIFTTSEARVRRAVNEIDVGVLHVNNQTTGAEPHVPFGARRDSASASAPPEQGQTAREFFTQIKTVYHEA